MTTIDVVLTRGPGPDSDFVELEVEGRSVVVGDWRRDPGGTWRLAIPYVDPAEHEAALALVQAFRSHVGHDDAELKSIGDSAFDPRLHCSRCRAGKGVQ